MLYIVFFSALREREMRGRERDIYSNLSSLTLHSIVMLWKDFSHDGKFASRVIIRLRQIGIFQWIFQSLLLRARSENDVRRPRRSPSPSVHPILLRQLPLVMSIYPYMYLIVFDNLCCVIFHSLHIATCIYYVSIIAVVIMYMYIF